MPIRQPYANSQFLIGNHNLGDGVERPSRLERGLESRERLVEKRGS